MINNCKLASSWLRKREVEFVQARCGSSRQSQPAIFAYMSLGLLTSPIPRAQEGNILKLKTFPLQYNGNLFAACSAASAMPQRISTPKLCHPSYETGVFEPQCHQFPQPVARAPIFDQTHQLEKHFSYYAQGCGLSRNRSPTYSSCWTA